MRSLKDCSELALVRSPAVGRCGALARDEINKNQEEQRHSPIKEKLPPLASPIAGAAGCQNFTYRSGACCLMGRRGAEHEEPMVAFPATVRVNGEEARQQF